MISRKWVWGMLVINLCCASACQDTKREVSYIMTDEQLARLMLDVQLSEAAMVGLTEERKDTLRQLFLEHMTVIYDASAEEIEREIRKLDTDPEKMHFLIKRVKEITDSIR